MGPADHRSSRGADADTSFYQANLGSLRVTWVCWLCCAVLRFTALGGGSRIGEEGKVVHLLRAQRGRMSFSVRRALNVGEEKRREKQNEGGQGSS